MKAFLRLQAVVLMLTAVSFAQESLGDVARQTRAQRTSAPKVITNEDLPHAMVSEATVPSEAQTGDKNAKPKEDDQTEADKVKATQKEYLDRFAKEKDALELLNRELNVLQRESQIKTSEYYADAGTRLRDPKGFDEKMKKYADDIATKQKAVDEAKQKIDSLKEDARHAGVASSLFE